MPQARVACLPWAVRYVMVSDARSPGSGKPPPQPLCVLRGHTSDVQALAFLPNTRLLAAGDADGQLKLWDTDTRRAVHTARVHATSSGVLNVDAVPGAGDAIFTQGRDGTLKRWQLQPDGLSPSPTAVLDTHSYNFCRFAAVAAVLPPEGDSDQLVSARPLVAMAGTDPAAVELWDADVGTRAITFGPLAPPADASAPRTGMVMSLHIHVHDSGAPYVLAGYEDGRLRLWDARSPGAPVTSEAMHPSPVLALAVCARARRGATGAANAQVTHFDLDASAGRIRRGVTHSGHSVHAASASRGTSQLVFRAEGRLLAGATWDGRVRLWDAKARVPLASLQFHSAAAAAVAWANDARGTLASGGRDGLVALWRGLYPPPPTSTSIAGSAH